MALSYEDAAARLTPEAADLFRRMVRCHLNATGTREFTVLSFLGPGSPQLLFHGDGANEKMTGIDEGALQDLESYGMVQVARYSRRGEPSYRIEAEGLAFHKWWLERQGTAVEQAEIMMRTIVDGAAFSNEHPEVAHHLNESFALLLSGRTDVQTVSEVGDHLRKALMDVTSNIVGVDEGRQEYPIDRLKKWLAGRPLEDRERLVVERLIDLAEAALSLDHRLNHIRDESDRGRPEATWSEMRRAAWVTAMVCAEVTHL
jgi:hypothetical protein